MKMPASAILNRAKALVRTRSFASVLYALASAVSGRIAALAMSIVIARRIGPEGYGVFAFATSIALLAAQLGGLGWPMLVTRMIPKYVQERDWSRLRGLRLSADLVMGTSTLALATAAFAFALAFLDRDNPLFLGTLVVALLIIPTGFRLLHRQELAGINRAASGIFFDEAIAPLFVITSCLLFAVSGELEIYAVYIAGTYCSAALSRLLYRRWSFTEEYSATRMIEFKSWMIIALPMLTAVACRYILDRIDAIMLGSLSTVHDVGLYSGAFRLIFVISAIPMMTMGVIRPILARHYEDGRHHRSSHVMGLYYASTFAVSAPVCLVFFLFAEEILTLTYGEEFADGALVLRILAVGQIFAALTEASGSYLLMAGKERVFGLLSVVGVAIAVAANLWAIPLYGAEGTAGAMAMTNVLFFLATTYLVVDALRTRRGQEDSQSPRAR